MKSSLLPILSTVRVIERLSLALVIVVGLVSWSKLSRLPGPDEIIPAMLEEPVQTEVEEGPFEFNYRSSDYSIEPVADYELQGLVVTHNDIEAFADIYHDENSVDVKDICVIWGDNLRSDIFHKVEFWSEPWSCVYRSPTMEIHRAFNGDELSNNHLLASNESVRQAIVSAEVGDQIKLRGQLVNYAPTTRPEWKRKSSVVRQDNGNGACEVIFVDEFRVLQSHNGAWHDSWALCYRLGVFLFLLEVVLLISIAHAEVG